MLPFGNMAFICSVGYAANRPIIGKYSLPSSLKGNDL